METITVQCTNCRAHFDAEPNQAAAAAPPGTLAISLHPCPRCGGTNREIIDQDECDACQQAATQN